MLPFLNNSLILNNLLILVEKVKDLVQVWGLVIEERGRGCQTKGRKLSQRQKEGWMMRRKRIKGRNRGGRKSS